MAQLSQRCTPQRLAGEVAGAHRGVHCNWLLGKLFHIAAHQVHCGCAPQSGRKNGVWPARFSTHCFHVHSPQILLHQPPFLATISLSPSTHVNTHTHTLPPSTLLCVFTHLLVNTHHSAVCVHSPPFQLAQTLTTLLCAFTHPHVNAHRPPLWHCARSLTPMSTRTDPTLALRAFTHPHVNAHRP